MDVMVVKLVYVLICWVEFLKNGLFMLFVWLGIFFEFQMFVLNKWGQCVYVNFYNNNGIGLGDIDLICDIFFVEIIYNLDDFILLEVMEKIIVGVFNGIGNLDIWMLYLGDYLIFVGMYVLMCEIIQWMW